MTRVHAKLSASGAHRWYHCPGSVTLEESFPDRGSVYAAEGTLAHDLAEMILRERFGHITREQYEMMRVEHRKKYDDLQARITADGHPPLDSYENMERYVQRYVDRVDANEMVTCENRLLSIEERVDFSPWVPEGFGTADCVLLDPTLGELTVMDLKYGKGVPVDAKDNLQLALYALGAFRHLRLLCDINHVILEIVQPRLDAVSQWRITSEELLAIGEKIKPVAKEAFEGTGRLCEGEHCRFCKAKARCPERARVMFSAVEEVKAANALELLTPDAMGAYLAKCEGVTAWIKDLEEEALKQILSGQSVAGYKAVEGRSNRKITDEKGLAEALMAKGYEEAMIYKPKTLETLTNLERLVGKKDFAALSEGMVVKPKGKPTLVPEADKRPPYEVEAMFEKVED